MTQQQMTAIPIERRILSAVMIEPDLVSTVKAEGITAEDFTDHLCRMIYDQIFKHGATDPAILMNALPGQATEILQIETEAVTTDHVPEWCRTLKEYTARRKAAEAGRRIMEKAGDRTADFLAELKTETNALLIQQSRLEVRRRQDCSETFQTYREQMDNGQPSDDVVLYGMPIDGTIRHSKGEIFTLGAAPGTGKTSFALSAMLNMVRDKKKVALFSEEMPSRTLFARLVANIANVPLGDILYGKRREDCREAEDLLQRLIDRRKILIRGNGEYRHSVSGIETELRQFYNEAGGVDWFCVDYIQTVKVDSKVRDRREQIDLAVEGVKQIALDYHAACLMLSQLSRSGQQGGEIGLTALKESAHIEEASSIVAFLQKGQNGRIGIKFPKNRNSPDYVSGDLIFQPEYARFTGHSYSSADVPGDHRR